MSDEIVIYTTDSANVSLSIDPENDTVWANNQQIAELFGVDRTGVTRHINNILKSGEVDEKSNVQKLHIPSSDRPVKFYSLDVILSVGYRVNSARAIEFRKWSNEVLRKYIVEGAVVNERRIEQVGIVVNILARSSDEMVSGIADVLDRFSSGLDLLDSYDHQTLAKPKGEKSGWELTYSEARAFINTMSFNETSDLFGVERDESFKGIVAGIYQSFGGVDIYPSVQEKAANLLYLIVKDHSFTDGNKRIAAALFAYFLDRNKALRDGKGEQIIDNNALAAITLMIALSAPGEKEIMCMLVMNMLIAE